MIGMMKWSRKRGLVDTSLMSPEELKRFNRSETIMMVLVLAFALGIPLFFGVREAFFPSPPCVSGHNVQVEEYRSHGVTHPAHTRFVCDTYKESK